MHHLFVLVAKEVYKSNAKTVATHLDEFATPRPIVALVFHFHLFEETGPLVSVHNPCPLSVVHKQNCLSAVVGQPDWLY